MKQAVENGSEPRESAAADANARRRMLRLVAGGVPLMSGPPAFANAVAASSAFRAARNDGRSRMPELVTAGGDTWVRHPVDIVRIGPNGDTSSGATNVRTAYKVSIGGHTRYYGITSPYAQIDCSGPPPLQDSTTERATRAMMLVLFDRQNFSMIPQVVDPTLYAQATMHGLQGLHCSSWSSIYPNGGRPLSCSGV